MPGTKKYVPVKTIEQQDINALEKRHVEGRLIQCALYPRPSEAVKLVNIYLNLQTESLIHLKTTIIKNINI
ncbi:hypothetical protein XBP1_1340086 [Xenorhabdus bovienii str. puntauvense]|uniref:Uncharacterized protein n=1 Tax=Xenorhabdus bovienii str. puntauvense TaxID=1398201 RepID=A0A077N0D1_XENBV|nr:hypothetical protein XBP1_1340086 [Xenorhabdus bovienii str. puntauvense]